MALASRPTPAPRPAPEILSPYSAKVAKTNFGIIFTDLPDRAIYKTVYQSFLSRTKAGEQHVPDAFPVQFWPRAWSRMFCVTLSSPEEFIVYYDLSAALAILERVATEELGPSASLQLRLETPRGTEDQQLIVQVDFMLSETTPAKRTAFMRRYSEETPTESQLHITVLRRPQ